MNYLKVFYSTYWGFPTYQIIFCVHQKSAKPDKVVTAGLLEKISFSAPAKPIRIHLQQTDRKTRASIKNEF